MTRRWTLIKAAVWVASLAPLAALFVRGAGLGGLSLGANPVEEVLNVCGKTGLNLLVFTLCITPLRRATGINRLVSLRRLLGLFAFFYLVLHLLTYAILDLGLAWETLLVDIAERPYITVGFLAVVLLIPLAVTSTHAAQRRMGRNWVKLHKLVYVIGVLGVVHYWWQTKLDVAADPVFYAVVVTVLLGLRLQHWAALRKRRSVDAKPAVAASYQRVEPPQPRHEPGR
jgi:sulfoxide reductase heme-binding subunit YedZ